MTVSELMNEKKITKYRLSKDSGVPYTTVNDICSGKAQLKKCSAETVYKLAKALDVSMEMLTESGIRAAEREHSFEHDLPDYLQHDLDAYKEGLKANSSILDCLWGELYGSINLAEISEGVITPEHADYLRQKYLWKGAGA